MNEYCVTAHKKGQPHNRFPIGAKNEEQLYRLLRSSGMVRRTFGECLPDIPEPEIHVYRMKQDSLSVNDRKLINQEINEDDSDAQRQGKQARLGAKIALMKVEDNVWLVKRYLDTHSGKQVVVLGIHREGLIEMEKALSKIYKTALVIGGLDAKKKFDIKEKFLEKKIDIVVGNYDAMGVGMDFQSANFILLAEPSWEPDKHKQGIGRVRRFGQTEKVVAVFSLIEGSLDEQKFKTAARKELGIVKTLDNPKGV